MTTRKQQDNHDPMAAPTDTPALAMTAPTENHRQEETTRLLILAREGDCGAFGSLVTQCQQRVYRAALGMLRHIHDAEDATQEVFIRFYRYLHRVDPLRPIEPWIYRITMNVCRDFAKKRKKLPDPADPDGLESIEARNGLYPVEGAEERAIALEALSLLPARERMALVLRDVEGLTTEEVAEILGSSETTVRSQISRGRTRLRETLNRGMRRKP